MWNILVTKNRPVYTILGLLFIMEYGELLQQIAETIEGKFLAPGVIKPKKNSLKPSRDSQELVCKV